MVYISTYQVYWSQLYVILCVASDHYDASDIETTAETGVVNQWGYTVAGTYCIQDGICIAHYCRHNGFKYDNLKYKITVHSWKKISITRKE